MNFYVDNRVLFIGWKTKLNKPLGEKVISHYIEIQWFPPRIYWA